MPAKQKAPGVFTFAGKCYLSTLLTKKGGYCLHAFGGNVVMWQEALSLLPRMSQEKNPPSSTKLCRAAGNSSSRARAVTWHTVSLSSHRWEIAALIIRFLLLVPYGPQLACGVVKRVLSPERASAVLGQTSSQVWASSCPLWEQVFLTTYYVLHHFPVILALCCWWTPKLYFTKGHLFILQLADGTEICKNGCSH